MEYRIGNFGFYIGDQKLNSSELIKLAGLDIPITLQDVFIEVDRNKILAPEYKGVIRSSDNKLYAIVGNGFVPVQNNEAFEFMDAAANEDIIQYHTIGSIGDGARVFLTAQFGEFNIQDEVYDKQIMLFNSHDGSGCLKCVFTLVRRKTITVIPACDKSQYIKLRHTKNIKSRMHSSKSVLEQAAEKFNNIEHVAKVLVEKNLSREQAEVMIRKIVAGEKDNLPTRTLNIIDSIYRYFSAEEKLNYLALFNAFAEYLAHNKTARGELKEEARFDSCLFGSSADMMLRATYYLMKF
jgi:phage/plasmid-like protein (TIGR03299 family)